MEEKSLYIYKEGGDYLLEIFNQELILRLFKIVPLSILIIYFVYISYTDYHYRKIPDIANLGLVLSRLLIIPLGYKLTSDELCGALVMFALFFVVAYKFNVPIGGDIKAVTATAFYLGISFSLLLNFLAVSVSILWYLWKKEEIAKKNIHIPYGAMMMVAFVVMMCFLGIFLKFS